MRIRLETKSGEHAFECVPGESILFAGLRQGLTLPYECATGTCGTCRGRVASGTAEVAWHEAPGFARLRRDKGDVLMCQARAQSDCVLRVPSEIKTRFERHPLPIHVDAVIEGPRSLALDVMELWLRLSRPISFEAGQFVAIEAPGISGRRAYSMVNFERETRLLRLVVKRKPGGGFSEWLFGASSTGTPVKVFGPLGRATFHPEEGRNVLAIAGGSGIAGMVAIAERAVREGYFKTNRGAIYFGVRTLADGFYVDELARLVDASGGGLEVTLALSHEQAPAPAHPQFPSVRLAGGFVHEVAKAGMAGRYDNVIAFVAGPTPMVDGAIKTLVVEARLTPDRIRYDKFS